MKQPWFFKLMLALLSLGLGVYLLIPTIIYFSLTPEQMREIRQNKEAFLKYVPSWAPKSYLVRGLDLQGGIHLVLGVDIDQALNDKASRLSERLRELLSQKGVEVKSLRYEPQAEGQGVIHMETGDSSAVLALLKEQFPELIVVSQTPSHMQLRLDSSYAANLERDALDQTIHTLRSRIDKMGVSEPSIAKKGDKQVQIQLPGYDNAAEAKALIGRTAQLQFQMMADDAEFMAELKDLPAGVQIENSGYGRPNGSGGKDIYLEFDAKLLSQVKDYLVGKIPEGLSVKYGKSDSQSGFLRTYTLFSKIELTGEDLVDAQVSFGSQENPKPSVVITFSPSGGKHFADLTKASIGKRLAIVLEDEVNSAPVIQVEIPNGVASISMGGMRTHEALLKEANTLALVLKSGALPAPITFREERSVGPSLGDDSVKAAQVAFLVGSLLIALFMMFYYRLAGLVSVLGVLFNVCFILASLSFLGATITLPGIAGLLLTIGMAVDANVIINERIREELRHGKPPRLAIQTGYDAAFSAIFDANVTTFIAGAVLWQYGTGPIQNFATTLLIGTVFSVITAVFMTRIFFEMLTSKNPKTLSI